MNKFKTYFITIFLPLLIGILVSIIISDTIDYNDLVKPLLSPPSILFPIVWSILYLLMGISYTILKANNLNDRNIKNIYYLQLFVNYLWSIIFFIYKWRFASLIWIILLDILVIIMIKRFKDKNLLSGLLQIPYLIWILFATYLNLAIYMLNR